MPQPVSIRLRKNSRIVHLEFDDGTDTELSCEYLRVYSPSAEVKGHGPGQGVLQTGKEKVGIEKIEPVGTYAIKLVFDDGHDSGIYTWEYLYSLSINRDKLWCDYLDALAGSGYERKKNGEV